MIHSKTTIIAAVLIVCAAFGVSRAADPADQETVFKVPPQTAKPGV